MTKKNPIYSKSVIALAISALTVLAGCTADDDSNDWDARHETLTPVIATNNGTPIVTRAWASEDEPKGSTSLWDFYEDLYPMSLENDPEIGAFVLANDDPASFNTHPAWFRFVLEKDPDGNYKRDENEKLMGHWTGLNTNVQGGQTYYIYGFMSANNTSWNVNVAPTNTGGSYADGATMTMSNVKSVTGTDVCAVVGVLNADAKDLDDTELMRKTIQDGGKKDESGVMVEPGFGNFKYKAAAKDNFIYVWLDHLYSCINFELMVDSKYSELRKIKLTQVDFTIDNVSTDYNITVRLGSSGIISTNYEGSEPGKKATDVVFKSTSGVEIPVNTVGTAPLAIPGYFAPATSFESQTVEVKFTYDVYTSKNNVLTRQGATATNKIKIGELLSSQHLKLGAGKLFTVKAVIKPTYLYVLADDDLDNPTVVIQ